MNRFLFLLSVAFLFTVASAQEPEGIGIRAVAHPGALGGEAGRQCVASGKRENNAAFPKRAGVRNKSRAGWGGCLDRGADYLLRKQRPADDAKGVSKDTNVFPCRDYCLAKWETFVPHRAGKVS